MSDGRSTEAVPEFGYFMPGEVLLQVNHPTPTVALSDVVQLINLSIRTIDRNETDGIQTLVGRLIEALQGPEGGKGVVPITFSAPNNRFTSVIPANLNAVDRTKITDDDLIKLIDQLNQITVPTPASGMSGVTLAVATPNWFTCCAQPAITGGPGARPVAAPHVNITDIPAPWAFSLNPKMEGPARTEGQPAHPLVVVILDSLPDPAAFDIAHKAFNLKHPLLKRMLNQGGGVGPDSLLKIHTGAETTAILPSDNNAAGFHPRLNRHDYLMTDHGLFIAGVIHSIAPTAQLELIEVKNKHGVGNVLAVIKAVNWVEHNIEATNIIINCSWYVTIPRDHHHEQRGLTLPNLSRADMIQPLAVALNTLFNKYGEDHVRIVGAAGNDGMRDAAGHEIHPKARFPAALADVIGVAARNGDRAEAAAVYSNVSDDPERVGLAVFGGTANDGLADADDGMLGIYLGLLPDGTPSKNGWARWAGTSFSTPVIGGALARRIELGDCDLKVAEAAVRASATASGDGENVVRVTQGTP